MDKFEKFLTVCMMTPQPTNRNKDPNDSTTIWGVPVNFIGGSGIAKSARIKQVSKALGFECWPIYSSTKQPEHFAGVPVMSEGGLVVSCILPQVIEAMDKRSGVIYLDEINTAPDAVQAALLSFVNERQVGEYTLPPEVRIVLAMNTVEVATNGRELSLPMVNRMAHFKYEPPSIRQWVDYMTGRYDPKLPDFSQSKKQVLSRWDAHYGIVSELTGEFLKANSGLYERLEKDHEGNEIKKDGSKLHDQPDPDDPRAAGPWPSPRTWELSVFAVAAARCLGMEGAIEVDLVSSLIGPGLATEWVQYMHKMNLPKPEDVLDGHWQITRNISIVRAVVLSAAGYVKELPKGPEKNHRAMQCWNFMSACLGNGYADILEGAATILINEGFDASCSDEKVASASEAVCYEFTQKGEGGTSLMDYILRKVRAR